MGRRLSVYVGPMPAKMVKEIVPHLSWQPSPGGRAAVLLSVCKGRGSLETALTSQSELVTF